MRALLALAAASLALAVPVAGANQPQIVDCSLDAAGDSGALYYDNGKTKTGSYDFVSKKVAKQNEGADRQIVCTNDV